MRAWSLTALVALCVFGCGSEGASAGDAHDTITLGVTFDARWAGQPIRCAEGISSPALMDLRFFVHDVRVVRGDGREIEAALVPDGAFQTSRVALLDFEDGTGTCRDGTHAEHRVLRLRVPRGDYRALRFRLGVPFAENHANPATAEAPLTAGSMSWGWRGGYKFLRFEARDGARTVRMHLGSTGCTGEISAIRECARPNRPNVELPFRPGGGVVVLALERLVTPRAKDGDSSPRDADCMGTAELDCVAPFEALGLAVASGASLLPSTAFTFEVR